MLEHTLIIFLNIRVHLYCVTRRTATFLLDVSAEAKCLCTATRILTLVASVLKLRLLTVVPAVEELTSYEMAFAN